MKNLDESGNIHSSWENIRQNIANQLMSAWIIMNLNSINYDLLQNISFEYGVPMAQLGLKNMFINKMFINAHLEILSVLFRVKNG